MNRSLRSIAIALGGDVVGGQVFAPGPNHSRKDRSLAVRLSAAAPGGLLIHSFAEDNRRDCRDYVERRLGIDRRRPLRAAPIELQIQTAANTAYLTERTADAVRLFYEARGPYGSPVEAYLRSRNVALPDTGAGEWVRFHPNCPFARQRSPAMVCLVRDMVTDEPKGIHRTALDHEGRAVEINGNKRLSFGRTGGGAIKITPHADVDQELGIGEGVETTLSLLRIRDFGTRPIWALLSAGNLRNVPMFADVRKLWIATDHDRAGLRAARELAARWRAANREARLIIPTTPGLDLNDLAMGGRLA